MTSDMNSKNGSLFLNCPQKIIHIELCDIGNFTLTGILIKINFSCML